MQKLLWRWRVFPRTSQNFQQEYHFLKIYLSLIILYFQLEKHQCPFVFFTFYHYIEATSILIFLINPSWESQSTHAQKKGKQQQILSTFQIRKNVCISFNEIFTPLTYLAHKISSSSLNVLEDILHFDWLSDLKLTYISSKYFCVIGACCHCHLRILLLSLGYCIMKWVWVMSEVLVW